MGGQNSSPQPPRRDDGKILAVFQVLGITIAVRFMLLLAVIGAFFLAYLALDKGTNSALYVLISYALLTIFPLVWLYTVKPR